jgi:CBS domain containing-hemolysin-like protein
MYRVSARLPIEDLGELFGLELENDEVETVGGLIGYELGRVPLPGSEVVSEGLILRGEGSPDVRGRVRISTVFVQRAPISEDDHDDDRERESDDA